MGAALLAVALVLAAPLCTEAALNAERNVAVAQALTAEETFGLNGEFVDTELFGATRVQEELGICSFESGLSVPDTLARIRGNLEEKGWTCISTDEMGNACLAKDQGTYGWAYVSCGTIDGTTVAVCNIAKRE